MRAHRRPKASAKRPTDAAFRNIKSSATRFSASGANNLVSLSGQSASAL
jgi:hypothetical protein